MKKKLTCLLALSTLATSLCSPFITVSANSAAPNWYGTTTIGSLFLGDECPLQVQNEVLSFNIQQIPSLSKLPSNYDASVTAEYSFYNPEEEPITATMLFPFGERTPMYQQGDLDDVDKYAVMVDGQKVEKEICYTWTEYNLDTYANFKKFEITKELLPLNDDPLAYTFLKPETPVNHYVINVNDNVAKVKLNLSCDFDKTCFYIQDTQQTYTITSDKDDGYTLNAPAKLGEEKKLCFTVIGEDIKDALSWTSQYTDYEVSVTLESKETTTFGEFIMQNADTSEESFNLSLYNATICYLRERYSGYLPHILRSHDLFGYQNLYKFRWYKYKMEVPSKSTVVNTVTVPVYPTIHNLDGYGKKLSYTYNYLLSPANTWASFENLTVNVNTPYAMQNTQTFGFTKTKNGYTAQMPTLPERELSFTLYDSVAWKNREKAETKRKIYSILLCVAFLAVIVIVRFVVEKKLK